MVNFLGGYEMIYAGMNYGDSLMFVFGGLALFIFGINLMSDSLKAAAGNRLKAIIEKTTNTPLKGIFVGIVLTVLIQSSSATTALMIGLLRAGLMTLPQSVGIIMGANIGTTVTAFIIGLPIADYGLVFVLIGVLMSFMKNRKTHHFGGVLIGLGMLFVGLNTMSDGLSPLAQTNQAEQMFNLFSNNWALGAVFGTAFTALIQSSSATIGILEKLYALNAEGITSVSLNGAIPIMLGANLGTTITAFLASIGGNVQAKRASFIHILFNLISAVVFLVILVPYSRFMAWFETSFLKPYSMFTIAFANLFQKTIMTLGLYFFINKMIWLSKKVVVDKTTQILPEDMFDEKLIQESPVLALELVKKGILDMGAIVKKYLALTNVYSLKEKEELINEAYTFEMLLDKYDQKLHDYLIKISQAGLDKNGSKKLSRDLDTIKDFERIGDHLTNIIQFFIERYKESQLLSEEGQRELTELYGVLIQMLDDTLISFETNNIELAKKVVKTEDLVDELEEIYRYRYIERLKNGEITFVVAENYADILSNLERIGDHLMNVASSVIEPLYVPQSVLVPKPQEIKIETKK